MALLILFWILVPIASLTENAPGPVLILFDTSVPDNSVAVIGTDIVEMGSKYDHYQVSAFAPEAVVLQDLRSQDPVRLPAQGSVEPRLAQKARHLFVVKQLNFIAVGQRNFFAKYGTFAGSFQDLLEQGFLADGMGDKKHHYEFQFVPTQSREGSGPQFRVIAKPDTDIQPELFFSVGPYGQVRFAENEEASHWGPLWDYSDQSDLQYEYIGTDEEPKNVA